MLEGAVARITPDAMIFALANPDPESTRPWPTSTPASSLQAVPTFRTRSATSSPSPGSSAALDCGARKVTEEMARRRIPRSPPSSSTREQVIVPSVFHPEVASAVAEAVRRAA